MSRFLPVGDVYPARNLKNLWVLAAALLASQLPGWVSAQDVDTASANPMKNMSIEQLMDQPVSLVSRSPQKLAGASSAVQVITGETIRHSGATNIPEALRLVTNLQVAQLNANSWIISSRGFNTVFANKLLVMIDGRTVYTPLFGGVLWELQNVLLEDVDRIEVVSGPGGTLWGANAVNGVINIITKNTSETRGLYASALGGTFVRDKATLRIGGKLNDRVTYKMYGQHFDRGATKKPDGSDNEDNWRLTQSGFRVDWNGQNNDSYTVQGDHYGGTLNTSAGNSDFNGQNVLARWTRNYSENSDLILQVYFDRYSRKEAVSKVSTTLHTYDVDAQYRFQLSKRQTILTGGGYRLVRDNTVSGSPVVAILPERKNLDLVNVFIQDEIAVTKNLKITAGTKVLHNVYTGIEFQPGVRALLAVKEKHTIWAAVSRAVRTPSRFDVDYFLPRTPQPPTTGSVAGGPGFVSEKLIAWELGYRIKASDKILLSLAGFYNVYDDLYSVEALPGTLTYHIQNGSQGKSWGAELSGSYQPVNYWLLRFGYTWLNVDLKAKPGHTFNPVYLANDSRHQALLQSNLNLFNKLNFNVTARYLSKLPKTIATAAVPGYFTFDAQLAYTINKFEVSVTGQNLASENHVEFNVLSIPRSVYLKLACRL